MKIVNIKGGLGNQMLQYAFAYKLKKLHPSEEILIDLKNFKGYKWHVYELKYVFDVEIPVASFWQLLKVTCPFSSNTFLGNYLQTINSFKKAIFGKLGLRNKEYCEKEHSLYDREALLIKGDCYYDGYWTNQNYFADIRDEILDVFSFKRTLDEINKSLLEEIKSTNSVSLHVRRGNYLLFDIYKGICELDYYQRAVDIINSHVDNPHYYIFSNDIEWCKENLVGMLKNYTFVDNNSGMNNYIDLQLMSNCKHNIIANSTFSWWGAWLNQYTDKIVVAPKKWLNMELKYTPLLEEWTKI